VVALGLCIAILAGLAVWWALLTFAQKMAQEMPGVFVGAPPLIWFMKVVGLVIATYGVVVVIGHYT
jgi:hypothetical protein